MKHYRAIRLKPIASLLSLILSFTSLHCIARPRPPLPPWPEFAPLLSRLNFDEPYRQGTNAPLVETDEGLLIESWSGYALVRSGPAPKPFVVPAIEGERANLATDFGAVRFWFKPYWSSASLAGGAGPGADATLLELFLLDENEVLTAWALHIDGEGREGAFRLLLRRTRCTVFVC